MQNGVTKARNGLNSLSWSVVGQTYVPKLLTDEAFVWHATIPVGSFVPPQEAASQRRNDDLGRLRP